jgi:dTDP-4-dehydrorhamnose reductase
MPNSRRILLLGASGRLGGALVRSLSPQHTVLMPGRAELDLAHLPLDAGGLAEFEFDTLINCAALTSPDACEHQPDLAWAINAHAPGSLARLCATRGARFIHISTDYIFPGTGNAPLTEADATGPLSIYAETKLAAERTVLELCPAALVVRVSWLFGRDKPAFPDVILQRARAGQPLCAISDKWSTPTSTDDLAAWLRLFCGEYRAVSGLLHMCNSGQASWREFAEETVSQARQIGLLPSAPPVEGQSLDGFPGFRARRPRYTVMSTGRLTATTGIQPRPWQEALRDYLLHLQERESAAPAN